jgi:hypothetical protein
MLPLHSSYGTVTWKYVWVPVTFWTIRPIQFIRKNFPLRYQYRNAPFVFYKLNLSDNNNTDQLFQYHCIKLGSLSINHIYFRWRQASLGDPLRLVHGEKMAESQHQGSFSPSSKAEAIFKKMPRCRRPKILLPAAAARILEILPLAQATFPPLLSHKRATSSCFDSWTQVWAVPGPKNQGRPCSKWSPGGFGGPFLRQLTGGKDA